MKSYFWNCSGGSLDSVFWVEIYGVKDKTRYYRWIIYPLYRLGRSMHEAKWKLKHRYQPKHKYYMINTGLEPGYHDMDERILWGCMAMLVRYIDECISQSGSLEEFEEFNRSLREEPDPNAPEGLCEGQGDRQEEALAIYRWWTEERPRAIKKSDELLMANYGNNRDKADRESIEEMRDLDDLTRKQDQEMLHRLIDIRQSLWT